MNQDHLHIILNPASAGGKTEKRKKNILREIENIFGGAYSLFITTQPLDARRSTFEAISRGCECVIAVGGDGTIQEVINGFFSNEKPINPNCHLGVISSGTGNGFAQSLGLPKTLKGQIYRALNGSIRTVDVGKVTFCNRDGMLCTRFFVNECQLGIGGAVVQRVQKKYKMFGGTIGFGLGTIETVFRHPNQVLNVTVDGKNTLRGSFTGIVVANGAFTGGGMHLAPTANVSDGMFNLLVMREMTARARLFSFSKIYSGAHIHLDNFEYQTARALTIESPENVLAAADGEFLGTTPCTFEIVPSSLNVRV